MWFIVGLLFGASHRNGRMQRRDARAAELAVYEARWRLAQPPTRVLGSGR